MEPASSLTPLRGAKAPVSTGWCGRSEASHGPVDTGDFVPQVEVCEDAGVLKCCISGGKAA